MVREFGQPACDLKMAAMASASWGRYIQELVSLRLPAVSSSAESLQRKISCHDVLGLGRTAFASCGLSFDDQVCCPAFPYPVTPALQLTLDRALVCPGRED